MSLHTCSPSASSSPGRDRGLAYISQAVAARKGWARSTTSSISPSAGRPSRPAPLVAGRAAAAASRTRAAVPADRLDEFRDGVEGRSKLPGRSSTWSSTSPPGATAASSCTSLPDGGATVVHEPNAYCGLDLDERTALLKIHGHVDRSETRERESFAVSEDDHIDYLVGGDAAGVVPVQLAARLRRSHLCFSATRWTTGACASSSGASGAATGSRTARGQCSLQRSTMRASCGMSAVSRCTTSRSRPTSRSSAAHLRARHGGRE